MSDLSDNDKEVELPSSDQSEIVEEDEFGDFDDFDEFEQQPEVEAVNSELNSAPIVDQVTAIPQISCLNEKDFQSSGLLYESVTALLNPMINDDNSSQNSGPQQQQQQHPTTTSLDPESYFNPRSASLWNQLLTATAHDHPSDWKRSSIRKLFFLSLGVPLDLDEIMPSRNVKRLVLPSASKTKARNSGDGKRKESDEIDISALDTLLLDWNQLAAVSDIALDGMDQLELESHIASLKISQDKATEWLDSLTLKSESLAKDKETFEGVIESLVEYASRMRSKKKTRN